MEEKEYEGMFILKPELQTGEFDKAAAGILDTLKKEKGEIISADKWSDKRPLAYELRVPATGGHVKYKDGVYYLVKFKINPLAIEKLKQAFKLNENVLRILMLVKSKG